MGDDGGKKLAHSFRYHAAVVSWRSSMWRNIPVGAGEPSTTFLLHLGKSEPKTGECRQAHPSHVLFHHEKSAGGGSGVLMRTEVSGMGVRDWGSGFGDVNNTESYSCLTVAISPQRREEREELRREVHASDERPHPPNPGPCHPQSAIRNLQSIIASHARQKRPQVRLGRDVELLAQAVAMRLHVAARHVKQRGDLAR